MKRRIWVVVLVAVIACSSDTSTTTTAGVDAAPPTSMIDETTTTAAGDTIATTTTSVPTDAIPVLSASVGSGARPELAWDEVTGADRYRVVVMRGQTPYWAWTGTENSVRLGGEVGDGPGAVVGTGMQWTVSALDENGHRLASSPWTDLAR